MEQSRPDETEGDAVYHQPQEEEVPLEALLKYNEQTSRRNARTRNSAMIDQAIDSYSGEHRKILF